MTQMLFFADPRPLVERLGSEFFRTAPECPGVYLMRDADGTVLYVGKAKNLRKRLSSYRVANPERLRRRHLRLLHQAVRIELRQCPDEASALTAEAELLRTLRPRFNRAGTWPGPKRFLLWRVNETGLDLAVKLEREEGWHAFGPLGAGVLPLRAALVRLLWCALHAERGLVQMPHGWFHGVSGDSAHIPRSGANASTLEETQARLADLFAGNTQPFADWIRQRTAVQTHPFELAVRERDFEALTLIAG